MPTEPDPEIDPTVATSMADAVTQAAAAMSFIDGLAGIRDTALTYRQAMLNDGFGLAEATEAAGLIHNHLLRMGFANTFGTAQ
jgi:hypothetical protein